MGSITKLSAVSLLRLGEVKTTGLEHQAKGIISFLGDVYIHKGSGGYAITGTFLDGLSLLAVCGAAYLVVNWASDKKSKSSMAPR